MLRTNRPTNNMHHSAFCMSSKILPMPKSCWMESSPLPLNILVKAIDSKMFTPLQHSKPNDVASAATDLQTDKSVIKPLSECALYNRGSGQTAGMKVGQSVRHPLFVPFKLHC